MVILAFRAFLHPPCKTELAATRGGALMGCATVESWGSHWRRLQDDQAIVTGGEARAPPASHVLGKVDIGWRGGQVPPPGG